jgi:hypothetical protein
MLGGGGISVFLPVRAEKLVSRPPEDYFTGNKVELLWIISSFSFFL